MGTTVSSIDRKLKATAGNRWQPAGVSPAQPAQVGLGLLAAAPGMDEWHQLPPAMLDRITFSGALLAAVQQTGMDDQELASEIHVSKGYFSRFLRSVGAVWARRFVLFCRTTRSVAPFQWIAHQLGGEFVMRDSRAAEVAALHQRLRELGVSDRELAA